MEVTPATLEEVGPDVLIVATGAVPLVPDIPGAKKGHVVISWDVLAGRAECGEVVAVVGGGTVGFEVADFLAEKGKSVTVLEMLPEIARDIEPRAKYFFRKRNKGRTRFITNVKVTEILEDGLRYMNRGWETAKLPADTVVLALGSARNGSLDALSGEGCETYLVGDSLKPRKLLEAVHDAARVALEI